VSQVTVVVPAVLFPEDGGSTSVKLEITSAPQAFDHHPIDGAVEQKAQVVIEVPGFGRLELTPPKARAMGYSLQIAAQEVWK
jgi:hypothetical protein